MIDTDIVWSPERRIRALHEQVQDESGVPHCAWCGIEGWPCTTIEALEHILSELDVTRVALGAAQAEIVALRVEKP